MMSELVGASGWVVDHDALTHTPLDVELTEDGCVIGLRGLIAYGHLVTIRASYEWVE
jgi:hypothetical protein